MAALEAASGRHGSITMPGDAAHQDRATTVDTIVFNDGSKYTGTLKNGIPDGLGTCVWKDGNTYDGEWKAGIMHGFGTYVWTSGQRYDGEWKDGKRDGVGMKLYADGSSFNGFWRDGKKHGVGVFRPAPPKQQRLQKTASGKLLGPSGGPPGAESISNLSAYDGVQPTESHHELPALLPMGSGKLPAASGPSTGAPLQAQPSGRVGATSASGAAEPGAGGREARTSAGGAAPSTSQYGGITDAAEGDAGGGAAAAARDAERRADAETRAQQRAERDKEREKEREKERKSVFIRAFEDGHLVREEKLSKDDAKMIFGQAWGGDKQKGRARSTVKRALRIGKSKLQQKHGLLLYKGMPGYDLMTKLQHGIRWSIGRNREAPHAPSVPAAPPLPVGQLPKLTPRDFVEKVKVLFPSTGSHITPAHPSSDFKWKDYCPKVFRNLRTMYGIQDAEYMLALGGSAALWQLNSPGKSGCMFFLSDDEKFLVKTMRKTEIRTLIDMLPKYYAHMESNPANLVIRFFGVHGVKQVHGRTVRFVVMHNMFNTELQIHKKFDLKGSTEGRTAGKAKPNDAKTVWKDLDLDVQILLDQPTYTAVTRQIKSDAEFLKAAGVMDYSLLLGVHFCSRARDEPPALLLPHAPSMGADPGFASPGAPPPAPTASSATAARYAGAAGLRHLDSAESDGEGGAHAADSTHQASPAAGRNGSAIGMQPPPSPQPAPIVPRGSQGGNAAGAAGNSGGGAEGEGDIDHGLKNFDLFTDRQDLQRQLQMFEERMRELNYSEQRIQDILGLARLRILGDKLKKRSTKASKVMYDGTLLLKAMASRRHDAEALTRLDEADEGPGSDEEEEHAQAGPSPSMKQRDLGCNVRALAVPKSDGVPEEVVLYFGIIDILQDWNSRKIFERTFKSLTHDSYAISVAPPKLYGTRFADFLTAQVFIGPDSDAAKALRAQRGVSGTIIEEQET